MPRTRSCRSLCREGSRLDSAAGRCDDPSHTSVISSLKQNLIELKQLLDSEREQRLESLRRRKEPSTVIRAEAEDAGNREASGTPDGRLREAYECATQELQTCKEELAATREALDEAREEREALRVKLSNAKLAVEGKEPPGGKVLVEEHPHLDWVGRHYLAVTIPEDHMFKPGQSVTPVGVLHKLFEMRVGYKLATGFSVLLENVNIMLSQMEPEWYATHFCLRPEARTHGNRYKSTDRIDTEEFAWLLFEYGAHAPLIEVVAGLLNVLNSAGKGGVTTAALCTSKTVYSSYVSLFRETVSKAFERFAGVRERAYRVRREHGSVYVPLTAGLGADANERHADARSVRSRALRSVIEGVEAPAPVTRASADDPTDPFRLELSLSDYLKRRGADGRAKDGRSSASECGDLPFKASIPQPTGPLETRVLFESPWVCTGL